MASVQEGYFRFQEYRVRYAEGGNGPTLVFLHPLGGAVELWEIALGEFAQDFHVLALDFLGCGKSDRPDIPYSISLLSDQVIALLDDRKVDRAALIGNSVGGHVAIHAAAGQSARVSALVAANASGLHSTARTLFSQGILLSARLGQHLPVNPPEPVIRMVLNSLYGLPGRDAEFLSRFYASQMDGEDGERWKRAFIRTLHSILETNIEEEASTLDLPTLILWGENDRLLGKDGGEAFQKLIRGSKLKVVRGAGHFPQLEQSKTFNDAIRDFMVKIGWN